MKVYLAGGINGLSDAECNDWRAAAKKRSPDTLDPMRRDYRGIEASNVEDIVRGDLHDIDECQAMLAMCSRPSWGTAMEIFYAHSAGKIVVSVVPPGPVSPWLAFHSLVHHSLDEAIGCIKEIERVQRRSVRGDKP